MNNNTTQTKLSADDAFQLIVSDVYAPAFFQELAAFGIVPENQKEAADLLDIDDQLRTRAEQEKQASANASRFSAFAGNGGRQTVQSGYAESAQIKQASAAVAEAVVADPKIVAAFEVLYSQR